jgi:hypothetical protein
MPIHQFWEHLLTIGQYAGGLEHNLLRQLKTIQISEWIYIAFGWKLDYDLYEKKRYR